MKSETLFPWSKGSSQYRTTAFDFACSINRYYDPSTDQFLSVDPDVQTTDQPYVYTNDDPLNFTDPLGTCIRNPSGGCYAAPPPKPKSSSKPSSSGSAKPTNSSSSTATTTLGGFLNGLANATANAGLALDVASAFDTSTGILTIADLVTVLASTFVNLVSTVSSCAAGYANNEAMSTVESNCEGQFSVYIFSATQGSPDSVKEFATVWGDARTFRTDIGNFINEPPW